MRRPYLIAFIVIISTASFGKSKDSPAVISHELGKVVFENRLTPDREPFNEPYRLEVVVHCKFKGKQGKKKHVVVSDWKNCRFGKLHWDEFSGKLNLSIMRNNDKTDYKGCEYEEKGYLKLSDYCYPKSRGLAGR